MPDGGQAFYVQYQEQSQEHGSAAGNKHTVGQEWDRMSLVPAGGISVNLFQVVGTSTGVLPSRQWECLPRPGLRFSHEHSVAQTPLISLPGKDPKLLTKSVGWGHL